MSKKFNVDSLGQPKNEDVMDDDEYIDDQDVSTLGSLIAELSTKYNPEDKNNGQILLSALKESIEKKTVHLKESIESFLEYTKSVYGEDAEVRDLAIILTDKNGDMDLFIDKNGVSTANRFTYVGFLEACKIALLAEEDEL